MTFLVAEGANRVSGLAYWFGYNCSDEELSAEKLGFGYFFRRKHKQFSRCWILPLKFPNERWQTWGMTDLVESKRGWSTQWGKCAGTRHRGCTRVSGELLLVLSAVIRQMAWMLFHRERGRGWWKVLGGLWVLPLWGWPCGCWCSVCSSLTTCVSKKRLFQSKNKQLLSGVCSWECCLICNLNLIARAL